MDHYLIVDGSNLLFQMFYGMPSRLQDQNGAPVHGIVGFIGALLKIIRYIDPTHVCVCFDGECQNARKELDDAYKANRPDYSRIPEEETPFCQLPGIYAALDHLGICHKETACCEADDWMAGFAEQYGKRDRVTLVSQDSDLFQLISERVHILRYRGEKTVICDEAYMKSKLGISPGQYVDYKSLTGDTADNIKGADRVGPKTAALLLQQYGTLEAILEAAPGITKPALRESLISGAQRLRLNQRLIRLDGSQPLPFTEEQLRWSYRGQTTGRILHAIGIQ